MYLCFFSAVVAILEGGLFRSLFEQLGILPFRQAGFRIGLQSLFLRWDIAMLFRGDSDKGNWRLAAHVLRHFAIPFIDGVELDEIRICPESIRLPLNCRCFGFRLHLDRVKRSHQLWRFVSRALPLLMLTSGSLKSLVLPTSAISHGPSINARPSRRFARRSRRDP